LLYWFLKSFIVGPVVLSIFRPWIEGRENVPASGAVIFASNHLSFSDSVFLPLAVDRQISFLAKSEYFTGTGLKGWFSKKFFLGIARAARRPRRHSTAGSSGSRAVASSASIRRALAATTDASTAAAPASHA
jgi:1-acyl-sn-glycerol-3-phosphate acyltransferase